MELNSYIFSSTTVDALIKDVETLINNSIQMMVNDSK